MNPACELHGIVDCQICLRQLFQGNACPPCNLKGCRFCRTDHFPKAEHQNLVKNPKENS